jgi:flagellar FliL protein
MPKDDDKTIVDKNGKEAEGEVQAETARFSGRLKKTIIFGGVGVAAIVLGIVVSFFVIKPMMADRGGSDTGGDETAKVSKSDGEKPAADKRQEAQKTKSGEPKESHVYMMKDIVINPAGTGGTRFLSVSFGFELESLELMRMFEVREPIVRDALITILSSKTVAQLTDFKQKEIIRYQIKKRVSQIMDTEELAGVYYTDFVLQ